MDGFTARRKLLDWLEIMPIRETARALGKTVVWTNGCFDLLHPGHLSSLQAARNLGDMLIVGINADASVKALKGPSRPILNQTERATLLAGLECVDYVIVFDEPTPEAALARLQPDIHCKGAEYAPPHGRPVPERATVEAYGGQVQYLPLIPGVSTTDIVSRILQNAGANRAA
jgi:rfaE bifunctional protein nucleotidyltransferase chain/domain